MPTKPFSSLLMIFSAVAATGAEPNLEALVDDQTLAVATVRFDRQEWSDLSKQFAGLAPAMDSAWRQIDELGLASATLVFGVDDARTGPACLVRLREGVDPAATSQKLRSIVRQAPGGGPELSAREYGRYLLVGQAPTVERYAKKLESGASVERADLTAALAKNKAASAVVVCSPGQETRRVIRELWPTPPAPWDQITGPVLADGLRRATATISPSANELRVVLAGADASAAETLQQVINQGLSVAAAAVAQMTPDAADQIKALADSLRPVRKARRLQMTFSAKDPQTAKLISETLPIVMARAQNAAYANKRLTQMKLLALAMLNYESAYGAYPAAAAIRDADGRPLLSWRVAVLPFIDEKDLYDRFHLDEPWDSPHNRELLKEMPQAFTCYGRADLTRQGMTVCQVPTGPRTLFPPPAEAELVQEANHTRATGTSLRDAKDGLSNTLLIVEVAPEHAVPWTKPADWRVDADDPLAALQGAAREAFCTAWGDGHARRVPTGIDADELIKATTHDGRESLDYSKW